MIRRLFFALSLSFLTLPAFATPVGMPMPVAPKVFVSAPIAITGSNAVSAYRSVRAFWLSRGIVR